MSTVRINDNIKKEVMPILNDLGLSLGEAINLFLHQIKLNDGIPFNLRRKNAIELYDNFGSYICEQGHIHDYNKINFEELEKEAKNNKTYNTVQELIDDLEGE